MSQVTRRTSSGNPNVRFWLKADITPLKPSPGSAIVGVPDALGADHPDADAHGADDVQNGARRSNPGGW